MGIKFGIFPLLRAPGAKNLDRVFRETCEEMKLAEEVGFDLCLVGEHHQAPDGQFPASLVISAAIAAQTTRMRVGPGVLVLPVQHPMHVAEAATMVDIVSGGRLVLGLGIGYMEKDFNAFGVPFNHRVSLMDEGIEVIKRAWTEDKFSFQGKRYSLHNVSLMPKPIQQPHPPIWIGAWTMEGVKRAGRVADGWVPDPIQGVAAVKAMAGVYRDIAAKRGRPTQIILNREGFFAKTRAEAVSILEEHVMEHHRYYFKNKAYMEEFDPWVKDIKNENDLQLDRIADRMILGSPEECIDQIQMWKEEVGIDGLIFRMRHAGGPSHEQAMQAIRLFGEKVIPHFA